MKIHDDTPVLVVEDSDEDFDTVIEATRGSSIQTLIQRAMNGDECLEALLGNSVASSPPAIVFMDLNTPGTDGRSALCAIRALPTLRSLPIVVLSTSFSPKDVEHCYAHGANAYHVKPLRYRDHVALVRELFTYWLQKVVLPDMRRSSCQ